MKSRKGVVKLSKINWKIRFKSKAFWLTVIPALLLLLQIICGWFGYNLAANVIGAEAARFVEALFIVLAILGIVNDPTITGITDSERTLKK